MFLMTSIRAAIRGFRKSLGFVVLTTLSLALGLGVTVALLTVVNAILIRPLPYPDSKRVVYVQASAPGMGMDEAPGHRQVRAVSFPGNRGCQVFAPAPGRTKNSALSAAFE
jgi:hypothetical protein